MSAAIPDLENWIQIYLSTTSSVESQRNESIQILETQIQEHPVESLQIMVALFGYPIDNQDHAITVKSQVCLYISRLLKLHNPEALQQIFQANQSINPVLQILREQLFSENDSIRDSCAQIFSSLFAVFGEELHHFFTEMISPLSSQQITPFHYGIINMLLALLHHKLFFDVIAPIIQTEIDFILNGCIIILGVPYTNDTFMKTRIISATFLSEFISKCPSIFNPPEAAVEKVNFILSAIQNSIVIPNKDLYEALLQLLLSIIKTLYPIIPQFMKLINQFASIGLNSEQPQFVGCSLYFFGHIAAIEKDIQENHLIFVKRNSPKAEEPFSLHDPPLTDFQLIPIFIEHLSKYVKEDDIAVERPLEAPQPNMHATLALQFFFEFRPMELFNQYQQAIGSLIAQPKNWIEIHSALSLMYAVLNQPTIDSVGQYILQFYNSIINCCAPDQPPRLRETALFLFNLLFKNYPQCILQLSHNDARQKIESILRLFEQISFSITPQMQLTHDDLTILSRCSFVLSRLAAVYSTHTFEDQISSFFDRFIAVSRRLFAIGQSNESQDLISKSAESISQSVLCKSYEAQDKLPGLYEEIFTDFENLSGEGIKNNILFHLQAEYCSIITSFVIRFRDAHQYQFIEQIAPRTLEKLFALPHNSYSKLYDEFLITVSSFIRAASNNPDQKIFGPDYLDTILLKLFEGLNSGSPQLIKSASLLLGTIYASTIAPPDYLIFHFERFYSLLGQLLFTFDHRSVYPKILLAIGHMFQSPQFGKVGQNPFRSLSFNEVPVEESLKQLMLLGAKYLDELDFMNKKDRKYGNKIAQYLVLVYGGYAKNFYCTTDINIEREQLCLLDKLARTIYKLYPSIDPEVILEFAYTCKLFGENCSRRNNVVLNRQSNHRILKIVHEWDSGDKRIIRKALEAIEFIKNK